VCYRDTLNVCHTHECVMFLIPTDAWREERLQHTATHYNTLQHTATHCNTRQTLGTRGKWVADMVEEIR